MPYQFKKILSTNNAYKYKTPKSKTVKHKIMKTMVWRFYATKTSS